MRTLLGLLEPGPWETPLSISGGVSQGSDGSIVQNLGEGWEYGWAPRHLACIVIAQYEPW
jgi:hypothetical protein